MDESRKLVFVTGNVSKFVEAQKIACRYGVDLQKRADWLNLMSRHSDRTIEVCENVTYCWRMERRLRSTMIGELRIIVWY